MSQLQGTPFWPQDPCQTPYRAFATGLHAMVPPATPMLGQPRSSPLCIPAVEGPPDCRKRGGCPRQRLWCPCTPSVQKQWDHSKGHQTALLVSLSQAVKPLWELVGTHSSLHPKCFPYSHPTSQHQSLEFAYKLLIWLPASQFPGISPHNARRPSLVTLQTSAHPALGCPSALQKPPALPCLSRWQGLLPGWLGAEAPRVHSQIEGIKGSQPGGLGISKSFWMLPPS